MSEKNSERPLPTFLQQIGEDWKRELKQLIKDVVREELEHVKHKCRFDITDKDVKEFGHYIGMVTDMGNGRLGGGIEVMRDNHKWMKKQRERGDKLSTAFIVVITSSVVAGTLGAIWLGFKHMITGK